MIFRSLTEKHLLNTLCRNCPGGAKNCVTHHIRKMILFFGQLSDSSLTTKGVDTNSSDECRGIQGYNVAAQCH